MRPIEHGYLTDAFTEGAIWERLFGAKMLGLESGGHTAADTTLLLTAPPFAPVPIEVRACVCVRVCDGGAARIRGMHATPPPH